MDRQTINAKFKELAEYKRIEEEAKAYREQIEAELKEIMTEEDIDTLIGDEHKATYKAVTSSRFDSKAFKAAGHEELYKLFTKSSISMRFTFA